MLELVCDRESVTEAFLGDPNPVATHQLDGIVCRSGDRILAAWGFENWNGANLDVHLLVRYPARVWIRAVLAHIESLAPRRMTAHARADNGRVIGLIDRLGGQLECVSPQGFPDCDMHRYAIWRESPKLAAFRAQIAKG